MDGCSAVEERRGALSRESETGDGREERGRGGFICHKRFRIERESESERERERAPFAFPFFLAHHGKLCSVSDTKKKNTISSITHPLTFQVTSVSSFGSTNDKTGF